MTAKSATPTVDQLVGGLMVTGLVVLAGTSLLPLYETWRFFAACVGGAVLGGGIAWAGARWRWPASVVCVAAAGCFAVVGVPLGAPSRAFAGVLPTPDALLDVGAAVILAWRRVLTIEAPVGAYDALLVVPLLLTLVGSVVGVSIATRSSRPTVAVLAPGGVLVAGILFGTHDAVAPTVPGVVLVLAAVLWSAWQHRRTAAEAGGEEGAPVVANGARRRALLQRATVGAALVAMAVVAGVTVGTAMAAGETRTVLRDYVNPPFHPEDFPSPLAAFRAYLKTYADEPLFSVSGLPSDTRIRLAVLDDYDGVVFNVAGSTASGGAGVFHRLVEDTTRAAATGEEGKLATIDVSVGALAEIDPAWLPTVGVIRSVDFATATSRTDDHLYYNDATDALATTDGLRPGDAYRLEVVIPAEPSSLQIASEGPGTATLPVPRHVPDQVGDVAADLIGDKSTSAAQVESIADGLAETGFFSDGLEGEATSRSGHGADRVAELLGADQMVGDEEQYATAMVLMARGLGFPARVVLGFAPTARSAGALTVTGDDVSAWAEVQFSGVGWTSFDPTPDESRVPEDEVPQPKPTPRPQVLVPPPPPEEPPSLPVQVLSNANDEPRPDDDPASNGHFWVLVTGVAVGGVLLALSPFLLIIGWKARRRARRRRADILARFVGGWDEVVDTAADLRIPAGRHHTRLEIADRVDDATLSPGRALALAQAADAAVFGAEDPDESDAEVFWSIVDEYRHEIAASRGRFGRLRAAVSLRSLTRKR